MAETKPEEDQGTPPDPNELLANNLKKILGDRTPETYAQQVKPMYISGTKKGKKVASRTIRAAMTGEYSPRLDFLAAIAFVESLLPYQLLFYEFDPDNVPVMITKAQEEFMKTLQSARKVFGEPGNDSNAEVHK